MTINKWKSKIGRRGDRCDFPGAKGGTRQVAAHGFARARAADGEALTGPWAVADARRSGRLCGRRGFARGRVRQAAVVESGPSGARVFFGDGCGKESVLLFFHGPGTAAGIVMQTLL